MSPFPEPPAAPVPADDTGRRLTLVAPDDARLPHVSVAGGTYTILVRGSDTAGKYTLIDMLVPPGGGPPPHRHDFEESFTVVAGQIELTFRGVKAIATAGQTVNIPANAPHSFRNTSDQPARLTCLCVPAGQEEMFLEVGDPVETRTAPPPELTEAQTAERKDRAAALAAKYKTEFVRP